MFCKREAPDKAQRGDARLNGLADGMPESMLWTLTAQRDGGLRRGLDSGCSSPLALHRGRSGARRLEFSTATPVRS